MSNLFQSDTAASTTPDFDLESVFVDSEEASRLLDVTTSTFKNRIKEHNLRVHGRRGKLKFVLRDVLALRRRLAEQDRRRGRHSTS